MRHDRITAPCVFDGPINGAAFRAWIEQGLASKLHAGDIVILDNLGSHKVAGVRQAIEARNARLVYLPPCSPDLNPSMARRPLIRLMGWPPPGGGGGEQVLAKLEHLLRKSGARTVDALHDTIRQTARRVPANRVP